MYKFFFPHAQPIIKKGSKPDVVLILGFAGSKPKNYRKIIEYYESKKVSIVLQVMPFPTFPFVRSKYEREIEISLKDVIAVSNNASPSLFVHAFSNNGAWSYASLSRSGRLPVPPSKLILDSTPYIVGGSMTVLEQAKAVSRPITSILLQDNSCSYHPIWSPIITSVFAVTIHIHRFIEKHQGKYRIVQDFMNLNRYLRDETPPIPALFVYSTGDTIVPPHTIVDFITCWRRRGLSISTKVFGDDVPHTSAFYLHTKEYKRLVDRFLFEDDGAEETNKQIEKSDDKF